MKSKTVFRWTLVLQLILVFVTACDDAGSDSNFMPSGLRGVWERTEEDWWFVPESGPLFRKGKLTIDYNSVTINGPMKYLHGFTQDVALEAYVEDGMLYIKDRGLLQKPIVYRRWDSADRKDKMVTFSGGGSGDESFRRVED
jgi:hypothetical protein